MTPGGGAVDHWASRPSGEVWVEVLEEDVVPLRAPPSVCSAKRATSKNECFFPHCMTERQVLTCKLCFFWKNKLLKERFAEKDKTMMQCLKNINYSNLTALPALAVQFEPLVNLVSAQKGSLLTKDGMTVSL